MKKGILLFALIIFSLSSFAQKKDNTKAKDVEAKGNEREDMRAILKVAIIFKKERAFPLLKEVVDSTSIVDSTFVVSVYDSVKTESVIDSFLGKTKFTREDHETEKTLIVKITKERKEILSKFFFAEILSLEERTVVHSVGLEMFYIKNICPDVIDLEKKIVNIEAERAWKVKIEEEYERLFDF